MSCLIGQAFSDDPLHDAIRTGFVVDAQRDAVVMHSLLAAPLLNLGRLEEARAAARQVLALQPSFSAAGFCAAIGMADALAKPMIEAWREAGLPP